MAECSYARCLQERRLIKRELMKWSKDMLNIVGLERVAEELMGRRKWKHYQETLTRTHLNTDELTATIDQLNIESKTSEHNSKLDSNSISIKKEPPPPQQLQQQQLVAQTEDTIAQQLYEENHRQGEVDEDQAKKHHRIAEDVDVKIDFKTETEQKPAIHIKRAASEIKENISKLLTEDREDNNNSNTITSHKHNNINNKNTTSLNTETVNITEEQNCSPRQHNHSDLLTNLRLRRVLRPESIATTTPPLASASESKSEADQVGEEEQAEPIDWKPNEKCYFCIDGKLLTVNDKGELVAESGPASSEADHANRQLLDTESDSNDSYAHDNTLRSKTGSSTTAAAATSVPGNQRGVNVNKLLASHLRDQPANMTSMDSMAARLAAIRSISGQLYPNLDFNWLLAQQQQQQQQQQANSATPTTSDTSATAISPVLKDSPGPSDATGEQPLDLSSKPSPNSSISGDLKSSTRSKPSRATPVPTARRTYSDDDLSNALQDIISGKLGTRKAAVQYNIPRSTLRNKVYKLTMDEKRLSNAAAPTEQLLQQLHQELELERNAHSGDEEESNDSTPQLDATHQQPPPPAPPLLDDLASRIAASATLRKLCESNSLEEAQLNASTSPKPTTAPTTASPLDQLKRQAGQTLQAPPQTSPQPQMAPILIDPNVLLQTLLLSAGALQNSANLQPKLDETVTLRDLFGAILFNSGINLKDALAAATSTPSNTGDTLNNGSGKLPNMIDQRLLLQQLQQQASPASAHSHSHYAHRLPKSETPETSSSLDLNEASDDPSVILKIPSYKPVAGSSSSAAQVNTIPTSSAQSPSAAQQCSVNVSTSRNGDSPHSQRSAQSPRIATSMLAAAVAAAGGGNITSAHQQPNNISVISPPLMRHSLSADSQSPPSFSLRDVIANSIHRTMNEQANKDAHAAAASMLGLGAGSDSERNAGSDYKTPSISVVKNIGGTDTSRFGKAPNLLSGGMTGHNSHHHHHHHQHHHLQHAHHSTHHLSRQEAAALAAGKGTRPKRGKYRNYDRDSLVEAVKAVQRGEMSVHRAGSYYGVPHSTLEYKVKERHLMRPRKREPKPQPLDGTATTSSASKSNSNIPGHSTANNLDKLKGNASNASSNSKLSGALKNNSGAATYANTSPNGMKLSMFDPNVAAAQMQYAPHLFWPHSAAAFGPMQMDFNRNAAQSGNAAGNVNSATTTPGGSVSPYVNADILKSHIQRYQEESMRSASASSTNAHKSAHTPSPIASPMPGQNHHALSYKSARELAENIYDSAGNANGSTSSSFLDGIIRKTLDRKSNDVAPPSSGGALLDQLLVKKIPLPFTNNRSNDYASTSGAPLKRAGSPLASAYGSVDIKRERSSPLNSDEASNSEVDEHNNNNNNRLAGGNDGRTCIAARHRITSRDSDTDGSSGSLKIGMPTELLTSQHYNNSSSTNITDLNGGAASKLDIGSVGSSILQEKLGQIKAERDSEENL